MTAGPIEVLLPLFGLIVDVSTQVIVIRVRGRGLLGSIVSGFAAGLTTVTTGSLIIIARLSAPLAYLPLFAYAVITYAALGYGYFHFVNLTETARRIRLMRELLEAGPDGLAEEEIIARYGAAEIVRKRLERLIGSGQVELLDGRLHARRSLTGFGAAVIEGLRRLLLPG